MVAVIFNALLKTLRSAETLDDIVDLIGVMRIYGIARIEHGTALCSKCHWLKGFDGNGVILCLISSVRVLELEF